MNLFSVGPSRDREISVKVSIRVILVYLSFISSSFLESNYSLSFLFSCSKFSILMSFLSSDWLFLCWWSFDFNFYFGLDFYLDLDLDLNLGDLSLKYFSPDAFPNSELLYSENERLFSTFFPLLEHKSLL